jgi:hypothetical protein
MTFILKGPLIIVVRDHFTKPVRELCLGLKWWQVIRFQIYFDSRANNFLTYYVNREGDGKMEGKEGGREGGRVEKKRREGEGRRGG